MAHQRWPCMPCKRLSQPNSFHVLLALTTHSMILSDVGLLNANTSPRLLLTLGVGEGGGGGIGWGDCESEGGCWGLVVISGGCSLWPSSLVHRTCTTLLWRRSTNLGGTTWSTLVLLATGRLDMTWTSRRVPTSLSPTTTWQLLTKCL